MVLLSQGPQCIFGSLYLLIDFDLHIQMHIYIQHNNDVLVTNCSIAIYYTVKRKMVYSSVVAIPS